ncbi:MAG: hypothetical protein HC817_11885, partial [Saprospiraceae bacterium]|nr:hypothetical protein [Saprospiraceae bacterium]
MAKDSTGADVQVVEHFTLYDTDDKLVPSNQTQFMVYDDKTLEPFDDAEFYLGTAEESLNVLFEIERNGILETQDWIPLTGLQKYVFKIKEEDRGNIHYHLTFVKNNRFSHTLQTVRVPYSNKDLSIDYQSFRDKLAPGQEEEWRIKISGKNKDRMAAEVVAAMYDASLNQFADNNWGLNLYPYHYPKRSFAANTFDEKNSELFYGRNTDPSVSGDAEREYPELHWFGFIFSDNRNPIQFSMRTRAPMMMRKASPAAPAVANSTSEDAASAKMEEVSVVGYAKIKTESVKGGIEVIESNGGETSEPKPESNTQTPVQVRTNLK